MDFENKLEIGAGIYTASEIAHILRLPYYKVQRWITNYWDGKLGKEFAQQYSWKTGDSRAVSFHTLVEFYVMLQFAEVGVKTHQVLLAHQELTKWFNTAFPFAHKDVISNIRSDGNKIFLERGNEVITLDGSKQLNLQFIQIFFKKLEFDNDSLAARLWPLGKSKSIIIDPNRKFGHPVIGKTNIYPETINNHIKAGDPIEYISYVYNISKKEVQDALEYCNAA